MRKYHKFIGFFGFYSFHRYFQIGNTKHLINHLVRSDVCQAIQSMGNSIAYHTQTHTHTHIYVCVRMYYVYIYIYIIWQIDTSTYIHTHIHIHAYIYIQFTLYNLVASLNHDFFTWLLRYSSGVYIYALTMRIIRHVYASLSLFLSS